MTYIRVLLVLLSLGAPALAESEAERFIREGGIMMVSIGVVCYAADDMVAMMKERDININEQKLTDRRCRVIRKAVIQRIEAIAPLEAVNKKRYCLTMVAVQDESEMFDAYAAIPYAYAPTQPCGENG